MGRNTIVTMTCDAERCLKAIEAGVQEPIIALKEQAMEKGREIDVRQEYLQASVYGFYSHKECFLSMTSVEVCRALGLDEVEVEYCQAGGEPVAIGRVWNQWS